MVHRGLCTYLEKIRNIQSAGADFAIIINDNPDFNVKDIILDSNDDTSDIAILGAIISYEDGQILTEYHENERELFDKIELYFDYRVELNHTAKIDLWYTPDQYKVYKLLDEYYKYQKTMQEKVALNIHMMIYPSVDYIEGEKRVFDNCLSSGKYCCKPGKFGIKDGSLIVKEALKQKCIYNYALNKGEHILFFDYMRGFYFNCVEQFEFTEECSSKALKETSVPINEIDNCIYNSFVGTAKEKEDENYEKILENKVLLNEYNSKKDAEIGRSPSLFINENLYLGEFKGDYLLNALCGSLEGKPEVCYSKCGFARGDGKFPRVLKVVFGFLLIFAFFAGVFLSYRKFLRRKKLSPKIINEKVINFNLYSKISNN